MKKEYWTQNQSHLHGFLLFLKFQPLIDNLELHKSRVRDGLSMMTLAEIPKKLEATNSLE